MNKNLQFFIALLLFIGPLYGQSDSTVVQVFKTNFIHFGDPAKYETETVKAEESGRVIRRTLELPQFAEPVQITAHLIIQSTIDGCNSATGDPWDRAGTVMVSPPGMANIELLKFITGFGGRSDLRQDVSHLAPLLQGTATIKGFVDTWVSPGWRMDFELIYKKVTEPVNPSWNHGIFYHQDVKRDNVTVTEPTVEVNIPPGRERTILTWFTSGHGINENSGEGDEFTTRDNVIFIDEKEVHRYRPWRDDCRQFRDRNPCSGRWGSTWSSDFPRSGWCPGDIVVPVNLDVTELLTPGHHKIRFAIENIRKDAVGYGYWRTSSHLSGWGDISSWHAEKILLTGPEKKLYPTKTIMPFRLDLVDAAGYLVITAGATIEVSCDSLGPVFSTDRENWSQSLEIVIENGTAQFWMQSERGGEFVIKAKQVGGTPLLQQPENVTILINDFEPGEGEENFSLKATAKADCECNRTTETARHGIDGSLTTKWCCNNGSPDWLQVTLADTTALNYFIIRHAGSTQALPPDPGAGDGPGQNTTAFNIQVKDTAGVWVNVVSVANNPGTEEGNVTYHALTAPVKAKEVRLFITDPGGDNAARIYEFEMYNRNPTGIPDQQPAAAAQQPRHFFLYPNFPNPFNSQTQVKFFLPERGKIIATVMNSQGQFVTNLLQGELPQGLHSFSWNGKNYQNADIATGIYFLNIKYIQGNGQATNRVQKMTYIR